MAVCPQDELAFGSPDGKIDAGGDNLLRVVNQLELQCGVRGLKTGNELSGAVGRNAIRNDDFKLVDRIILSRKRFERCQDAD